MLPLLLALLGCSAPEGTGPLPLFGGEGFFDRPFPSDARTTAGHPDLEGFPGQGEYDLLDTYLADIESLVGFGANAPIWVRFDGALDTARLPDPQGSLDPTASLLLLDIDERSPSRGQLWPLSWTWDEPEDDFRPEHLLAVRPLWGRPLHPGRRYALVLRTDLARRPEGFEELWTSEEGRALGYPSLQEVLFSLDIPLDEVALATTFTTQDPLSTVRKAVSALEARIELPRLDQRLREVYRSGDAISYQGYLWLPLWQDGESPFLDEGGGFVEDEEGRSVITGWQRVIFWLTLPRDGQQPADGWPVVIHGHGTGGDYSSHSGWSPKEPTNVLARRGIAGFAISLPLHGDRGTGADPSLLSFNYFNPPAARGNFQQAVLDLVWQARVLGAQPHRFELQDSEGRPAGSASLDPGRLAYLGHSHGGIVGAMAAPWLGEDLRGAVLSGAGGGLSLSAVLRKEGGLDVQALIATSFGLPGPEWVTPDHPLLGLVQTLGEAVEPLNYAPYAFGRQPWWENEPLPILMTTGLLDEHTPSVTSQLLAGAAGLPVLDPVAESQEVQELFGLLGQAVPCRDNLRSWEGQAISGALAEFPEADHFPIFDDEQAIDLYALFLETAVFEDSPLIDWDMEAQ